MHEFHLREAPPKATRVVEGSHGRLYVDESGRVLKYCFHDEMCGPGPHECGYDDIARVNLAEFDVWNQAHFNGDGWDAIDILHVGTWLTDGSYEPADDGARQMSIEGG